MERVLSERLKGVQINLITPGMIQIDKPGIVNTIVPTRLLNVLFSLISFDSLRYQA